MKRKSINSKALTAIIIIVIAVISLIVSAFNVDFASLYVSLGLKNTEQNESGKMYVSFINVDQGNCALIVCGEDAILVDSGETGEAQNVINYLNNLGIKELDCVIATHPHSDHIGGMTKLLYEFEIKDFIMPEIPEEIIPTSRVYEKFLDAVEDNAKNVYAAEPGDTYSYGEMRLEILAPLRGYDNLNDMSVVSRISYGETSVMFTGDISSAVEKEILKKKTDCSSNILSIAHHGSKTSSSEAWLKAVNPEFAVISCGVNNDYSHPHNEVTNRLDKLGIKTFRTDLLGTVVFASDSKVFTEYN